ncbi:helix-turn-helix domain-containing protein [Yinghuangia seranimata]|uniref:helix-turn-helix domain-containing protein n=1 Tax=Yinghuangia seranimata TaxID=408067 RepID=UPI00248C69EE|nr:helix-turn-helix domain-containing protein [Yinghuangia seranimata]MDI2131668.1 helix-turn-helix domain-containing protein [Yinghuangia seranimata]
MTLVAMPVYDGAMLFEASIAGEVFGMPRPHLADPWYDFAVCGPPGARLGWLSVDAPHGLDRLARADTVIVPSCDDIEAGPPADLLDALRAAHARGARIASLCTGSFVLAAAGLLDGRRATTHWMHADRLAERYPKVRVDADVLYTDDGRILTAAGKAAAMDLSLHLVRLDHGTAVANALARTLVVPPHREGGQAQFIAAPVPKHTGDGIADLQHWALDRLHEPLTVQDLADRAGMSTRHLTRHFHQSTGVTPLRWLHAQRIRRAQELLETTDTAVERIAARTGMGTATTLRRHFHRAVGVPPDTYRRTFRGRDAS